MKLWSRPKQMSLGIGVMSGRTWPRIIMTPEASMKMEALVQCCAIEVSWLAAVDRDGDDFVVSDLVVPPQACSLGGTVFAEANYMNMFMGPDGKLPLDILPLINRLRAWGHSHHNMAVFASGTDEEQTRAFLAMAEGFSDYFIRLICNKQGEMNSAIFLLDQKLVIHQPQIISKKYKKNEYEARFGGDMYPFDDWAVNEIDKKVARAQVPLHRDDFTEGEDEDDDEDPYRLGRSTVTDYLDDFWRPEDGRPN